MPLVCTTFKPSLRRLKELKKEDEYEGPKKAMLHGI
jgi:hypothetical protein